MKRFSGKEKDVSARKTSDELRGDEQSAKG